MKPIASRHPLLPRLTLKRQGNQIAEMLAGTGAEKKNHT
jgi:hypothetical protein